MSSSQYYYYILLYFEMGFETSKVGPQSENLS